MWLGIGNSWPHLVGTFLAEAITSYDVMSSHNVQSCLLIDQDLPTNKSSHGHGRRGEG